MRRGDHRSSTSGDAIFYSIRREGGAQRRASPRIFEKVDKAQELGPGDAVASCHSDPTTLALRVLLSLILSHCIHPSPIAFLDPPVRAAMDVDIGRSRVRATPYPALGLQS
jgi:hypothetical protein